MAAIIRSAVAAIAIVALVVAPAAFLAERAARADENGWAALSVEGIVELRAPGGDWEPLTPLAVAPVGAEIRTGADGKAVLARGFDLIEMEPATRLELDVGTGADDVTAQPEGRATYKVGKRVAGRFVVRAPTLTVVVKGTSFSVDATPGVESVGVHDGAVSVEGAAGGSADVSAGGTASTAGAPGSVSVTEGVAAPSSAAAPSRGSAAPAAAPAAAATASRGSTAAAPASAAAPGPATAGPESASAAAGRDGAASNSGNASGGGGAGGGGGGGGAGGGGGGGGGGGAGGGGGGGGGGGAGGGKS